jgi:hypothetical protein
MNTFLVIFLLISCNSLSILKKTKTTFIGEILSGRPFMITSVATGKTLQVDGVSKDNDAKVSQWTKHSANHFKWKFEQCNNHGFCFIRNLGTGNCLHLHGAEMGNNAKITQWSCVEVPHLRWRIIPISGNVATIHSEKSNKCVHIPVSQSDGVAITQWDCIDQPNLQWRIEVVDN